MKDKIIYFIIGVLVGAIITTGCFLIFGKNNKKIEDRPDRGQMQQMDGNFIPGERNNNNSNFKDRTRNRDTQNSNSNSEKPSIPPDGNTPNGKAQQAPTTGTEANS